MTGQVMIFHRENAELGNPIINEKHTVSMNAYCQFCMAIHEKPEQNLNFQLVSLSVGLKWASLLR